jgi:PII-like signaling protein
MIQHNAVLLRIFLSEEDHYQGRVLYEAIVAQAMQRKMAGATVLPGPEGFGHSRHVRSELSYDAGPRLPVVIEIVDTEEQINAFLPVLNEMMESGLVTLEKVQAIHYPRGEAAAPGAPDA